MSEPVTVLVTRRVRPGQEQAFTAWLRELADVATKYPGHQGVIIPPPTGADDREYVIVFRFDSQVRLRAWQASDARRAMLARSRSMADEPPLERELRGPGDVVAVPGGQVRQP
jgi:antibiotic biosynthesis monooxygenase (ABM) superfamily enzyme